MKLKLKNILPSLRLPAFSLFLAVVAWFLVHSAQRVREEHNIPIVYKNLPTTLAFSRKPPEFVRFGFVGIFHRLRTIDISKLRYEVDLSDARAGNHLVEVTTGQFFFPVDVELVNPRPRRFELFFEPRTKRDVPVEANIIGSLPKGLVLSKLELRPNPITVEGPLSALSKLEKFQVDVQLRENEESWREFKEIEMPDWSLGENKSVELLVELSRMLTQREFKDVPVISASPKVKIQVFPSRAKVIVVGAEEALNRLSGSIRVEIPVEGLQPGRYRLEGRLSHKKGIQEARIDPKSFIVEVLN